MPHYTLYISEEKLPLLQKAKEIAKKEGKSLSELITSFIEDYVKKNSEVSQVSILDVLLCLKRLAESESIKEAIKQRLGEL
jgi:macrodomain Ter protein organizer (MatP/YcbG family)